MLINGRAAHIGQLFFLSPNPVNTQIIRPGLLLWYILCNLAPESKVMKKKYAILLVALLIYLNLPAQNTFIKDFRYPQKITIADGSPAAPNVAPIIRRLSEGNNKSIRSTYFTIDFDQTLRLNTREPDFVYRIESGKLRFSGDIFYKGFEVSEQLVPAELRFELRLKRPNGSFKSIQLSANINNEKPEVAGFTNTDTSDKVFIDYAILNHVFIFSNSNNFENSIRQINTYYQSVAVLDDGFALLQSVNPNDADRFRMNQKNLVEATNIYNDIINIRLESLLPLQVNDPARYLTKANAYHQLLMRKQNEMSAVWSTLHLNFYDRGLYQLKRGNLVRASELFFWALEVNPGFAPALLRLAEIDFRNGHLHEATCKADDILINLPTDPQTRENTFFLLNDIHLRYIESGDQEVSRKQYAKALDQYESARQLCVKYRDLRCSDALLTGISSAKTGIFNELLNEARDFVILNDLNRAESSAKSAIQYQENNRNDVKNAVEGHELLKAIRQKRYDQNIQKGLRYTDQRNYIAALEAFQNAEDLLNEFQLTEAKNIHQSILLAARPRALELLYEGESNVKGNRLSDARENYRKSLDVQKRYGLLQEPDLKKHTESLRKNIFTQQCLNAQNEIDQLYNQGQFSQSEGNYVDANQAYSSALNIKVNNPDCGCTTDSIESEMLNIRPAVTFLELMKASRDADISGRYQLSIDHFMNASKYYSEARVGTFGIEHQPDLFIYIREKGTNGLINYSGDYYRERGDLEHSLKMYKLLLERHYDPRLIEGALYRLGLSLGQRDKTLNPGSSWKDLVSVYTNGDKKLKRLRAGYKKGFKG